MKNILSIFVLLLFILPATALGVDCPHGLINDPVPGSCGLFRDTNNDGYCDLSETEESVNYAEQPVNKVSEEKSLDNNDYKLVFITIIIILVYVIGLILIQKKKITFIKHRKLWNWLLLIFFVPTAFTSLFLMLSIEYGFKINFGFNLGYWHLIFGWAFLLISILHVLWHLTYYFKKQI